MAKRREIRNSTAEFLIFQIEGKEQGVEVYYKDKTVWCTQKAMGMLFDCTSDNISVHLQNIYDTDELKKEATTEKISVVRREGNRDVNRTLQFYKLDAIISVGYRAAKGKDGKPIKVDIGTLTGDSKKDINMAETIFQNMGYSWEEGFTWHHIENTTSLLRVPTQIHQLVDHTGGMSMSGLK